MNRSVALFLGLVVLVAVGLWFGWSRFSTQASGPQQPVLHVLSYSSFVNSWGPGPRIAQEFEAKTGVKVILQDAGDAGLILKKLALLPADLVIGLDQLSLPEAHRAASWKTIEAPDVRWKQPQFVPFDWGPMAFIVREGEIEPPQSLDDLLDPRFRKKITLQDPRTSTPGLQFFLWVLESKGVEEGFAFLEKLKPNLHTVADSWSTSYGLFQKKEAAMTFSYLTSPVYHWTVDKDRSYKPVIFESGHPYQVEYAAVPASCQECDVAMMFVRFLLEPPIQKHIMETNFMLPVVEGVAAGTPFADLPNVKQVELKSAEALMQNPQDLFERWKKLGL